MEPSPLTQDSRPEIFQPKIIHLYETLFKVCALKGCRAQPANQKCRKTTRMWSYPMAFGKSSSYIGQTQPV